MPINVVPITQESTDQGPLRSLSLHQLVKQFDMRIVNQRHCAEYLGDKRIESGFRYEKGWLMFSERLNESLWKP